MDATPENLPVDAGFVHRLARALLRDRDLADDVAQDAIVVALERRESIGGAVPHRSWIAAVTRNIAARALRGDRERPRREQRAARPEVDETEARTTERLRLYRELTDAVGELPEPYRTAVTLRYLDGLPPRVIARRRGQPVAVTSQQIHRGLAMLRRRLDRRFGDRGSWLSAFGVFGLGADRSLGSVAGATVSSTSLIPILAMKKSALLAAAVLAVGCLCVLWWVDPGSVFPDREDPGRSSPAGGAGPMGATVADGGAAAGSAAPLEREVLQPGGAHRRRVQVLRVGSGEPVPDLAITCESDERSFDSVFESNTVLDALTNWPSQSLPARSDARGLLFLPETLPSLPEKGHAYMALMTADPFEYVVKGGSPRFSPTADGEVDAGGRDQGRGQGRGSPATGAHELWIAAGYRVEGYVYGADGESLGGAMVFAGVGRWQAEAIGVPEAGSPDPLSRAGVRWATTDARGRYTLDGIPPNRDLDEVGVFHPGHAPTRIRIARGLAYTVVRAAPVAMVRGCSVQVAVRSRAGGRAVPEAVVLLVPDREVPPSPLAFLTATTDGAGSARFEHLPAGRYTAGIVARGFAPLRKPVIVGHGGRGGRVECWLRPGLSLRGRVVDSRSRRPVAGATVRARTGRIGLPMSRAERIRTDAEGRFDFPAVLADEPDVRGDETRLSVTAPGYVAVSRLRVDPGAGDLVIAMVPACAFTVRVVDEVGEPVREYVLRASPGDRRPYIKDVCDAAGEITIEGCEPGMYLLEAETDTGYGRMGDVRISTDEVGGGVAPGAGTDAAIRIVLHPKPSIVGLVTATDGSPLEGVEVRCLKSTTRLPAFASAALEGVVEWLESQGVCSPGFGRTRTAPDGSFRMYLRAGTTGLGFRKDGYVEARYRFEPGAVPRSVEVALAKQPVIHGVVRAADGTPVAGAQVSVPGPFLPRFHTETQADGSFSLGVDSGAPRPLRISSRKAHGVFWTLLKEAAPAEGGLRIVVPECPCRLEGQVTDRGEPKAGVLVVLTLFGPPGGAPRAADEGEWDLTMPQRSVISDGNGMFRSAGLMPGRCRVQAGGQKQVVEVAVGRVAFVEFGERDR